MNHFHGKKPLQHVIEARIKGKITSQEVHGTELPGHVSAAADSAKETAIILLILSTLLSPQNHWLMLVFIVSWLIWKVGRSAILGFARLERFHRVIEEERYEIEHHRSQEKEELKALYVAKGFSGKLLNDVVEVLMADDNRLLQVMLQEELGFALESYEHPLKQAAGALVGVIGSALILSFGLFVLPSWGPFALGALIITLSAGTTAQLEKNSPLPSIVWNLAVGALTLGTSHFFGQLIK